MTEANAKKTRTGGQLLADALVANGVERIFCVPGESYLALLDALYDTPIKVTVARQEGGAAMMAEAWGKLTGRHKVTPTVSPKKTWEGLIGGIATTTLLASLIGPYLTPMDFRWSALAGLTIGLSGFLGDITMSAMKRALGVKDTGGLIPGHGGILDRVDSLTYAAPVFAHFFRYFFFP